MLIICAVDTTWRVSSFSSMVKLLIFRCRLSPNLSAIVPLGYRALRRTQFKFSCSRSKPYILYHLLHPFTGQCNGVASHVRATPSVSRYTAPLHRWLTRTR
ncbi:hypothetical protein TGRUB_266675 [Toxoplasma gondii RUB]|uniref:Uncharacterized protein n=10 Tax=Toxoplasma gondii TaxID=5811 RepID=A0A125YN94_TOXGV|nr:hypothetical protein TGGT1_266675 [Toxoplasma gondii GT1]ESS33489.1 hypothetical protein TGVEG_266675 [Toxoplasma gondii VEG]KAF4644134.1 hypothetical protein TGRH88_011320 [Toxoplasma gondii]KFG28119.1 hypothetical protein TGP89_266675 [Toxoplasma gondii p89]KFG38769.1 hypothetical protein TGDOM2_266675 [Toxoplasma gondii GAB2-2007-GAL-DOM2]KFG43150.1 hypothetical protein TGFOU_266675 [Toxoplasma gondii FOU]KFG58850.1 hypothetical protein TGRUB_266675 [Toxoplasma gondii RUB]KFH13809.1 hy